MFKLLNGIKVLFVLLIVILTLVNCEKKKEELTETPTETPKPSPHIIQVVTGNGQYVKNGSDMEPIIVVVKDKYWDGFGGAIINVTSQNGQIIQQGLKTNENGELLIEWPQEKEDGRQVIYVNSYKEDGLTHLQGSPITIYRLVYTNTIRDIDNNLYHTVTIGNQEWLMENLAVTRYNDGEPIVESSEFEDVASLTKAVFCWYTKNKKYGALYNWNVIRTGKISPTGWHVPSVEEWDELLDYVNKNGYENDVPHALKAANDWTKCAGVNHFGFSALPSGILLGDNFMGDMCSWWTSTMYNCTYFECAEMKEFSSCSNIIETRSQIYCCRSIRCVKD